MGYNISKKSSKKSSKKGSRKCGEGMIRIKSYVTKSGAKKPSYCRKSHNKKSHLSLKKSSVSKKSSKKSSKKVSKKSSKKSSKKVSKKSSKKSSKKVSKKSSKQLLRKKEECNDFLKEKIRANIQEYKDGRFSSRQQAVAVSYSQVRKASPHCRRYFNKK